MNGIHVIDMSKLGAVEDIEKAIGAILDHLVGPEEEITRPLRDKGQQAMRDLLFKQGNEINDKVMRLKRLLTLTADLIDLINEDHIPEDGPAYFENRSKQAVVTKKMIDVMDKMKTAMEADKATEKANGAASR